MGNLKLRACIDKRFGGILLLSNQLFGFELTSGRRVNQMVRVFIVRMRAAIMVRGHRNPGDGQRPTVKRYKFGSLKQINRKNVE